MTYTPSGDIKTNINTSSKELLVNLEGHQCPGNTTVAQLAADAVFTGSSWQDTLDYGVLSINVATDQDSATDGLDIQWSNNGTDIADHDYFTILANNPKTFTFGPAERYYRVVYTNGSGGTTTTFHLTSLLRKVYVKSSSHRIDDAIVGQDDAELVKAVSTGLAPDGTFKNVLVTNSGNQKISIEEFESGVSSNSNTQLNVTQFLADGTEGTKIVDGRGTGKTADVESLGALKTVMPIRLAGASFDNGTKDTNFWTETVTGSGSVTQAGEIVLATGSTADSSAKYQSTGVARKITGQTLQFRLGGRQQETVTADCIRRAGAYDTNNGFFFQYDGTVFQVVSRKAGVDTAISNGSFNGNAGTTISADETLFTRLIIEYTSLNAKFFVDGVLIHTISATSTALTESLDLPVTMEIINENGNTADNGYEVVFAAIIGLGPIDTASKSYYQSGTVAAQVLKYSAGILKRANISGVANGSIIILYDNTAASSTILWSSGTMGAQTQPFSLDFGEIPFNIGLTLAITGANSNIAVTYE